MVPLRTKNARVDLRRSKKNVTLAPLGLLERMGSISAESDATLLYELALASGVDISADMFSVVLDLLRLGVTPQGVVALLRSIKDAKLKAAVAAAS